MDSNVRIRSPARIHGHEVRRLKDADGKLCMEIRCNHGLIYVRITFCRHLPCITISQLASRLTGDELNSSMSQSLEQQLFRTKQNDVYFFLPADTQVITGWQLRKLQTVQPDRYSCFGISPEKLKKRKMSHWRHSICILVLQNKMCPFLALTEG